MFTFLQPNSQAPKRREHTATVETGGKGDMVSTNDPTREAHAGFRISTQQPAWRIRQKTLESPFPKGGLIKKDEDSMPRADSVCAGAAHWSCKPSSVVLSSCPKRKTLLDFPRLLDNSGQNREGEATNVETCPAHSRSKGLDLEAPTRTKTKICMLKKIYKIAPQPDTPPAGANTRML